MKIKNERKKAEESAVRDNVHSSTPEDSVNKETIMSSLEYFMPQAFIKAVYSFFQKVELN